MTAALGGGPLAIAVAPQVAAAVQSLLANDEAVEELSSVIGSVVPEFFGQNRVVTALANAAGQLTTAALDGDLASVLRRWWPRCEPTRISQGRWASLWVMW